MDDRRRRGAVFTPAGVARCLATAALEGCAAPATICDPAAGDGRLLAAVAAQHPGRPALFGADIDADAWEAGPGPTLPDVRFHRGDSLAEGLTAWPDAPAAGFDLVIGNPPFRNQLESASAHAADERRRLKGRFGASAGGYADTASIFLVAACEMAAADGRVAMIMPLSFLSARDAGPARRRVLELASIVGLWVAGTHVFPDAEVQVCALVLQRGESRGRHVSRWSGPEWTPAVPLDVDRDELRCAATWGHLLAGLVDGAPQVDVDGGGRLGDLVTATAGFRRQFYGLAPHVREAEGDVGGRADGLAPLITCGAIALARVEWGDRPSRIAGRTWQRPAIDPLGLDGWLGRWVAERRQPKLVVATQTRVIEAVADPTGEWVPSTPVIAVHGDLDALWRALAVLVAPPVSAWARHRVAGAAMSIDAIKLSAGQVLDVPLPLDAAAWDRAAEVLRSSHSLARGGSDPAAVVEAAGVMNAAYRCDDDVHAWWLDQGRVGLLAPGGGWNVPPSGRIGAP